MKVKVQTLDGKAAKNADIELSTMRCSASSRAPTSCTASSPGSSRTAAAPPVRLASARTSPAPARSSAARRAAAPPVTAIAARRSSSAAARPTVRVARDFDVSLNKKIRALGLKMALSAKAKDGLVVIDNLDIKDAKTKALAGQLAKARLNGKKVLVIDGEASNAASRCAAGNLNGINVLPAVGANVYDILKHDTLVLTRAAVEKLEARFNG